jgi:hypothetical protein
MGSQPSNTTRDADQGKSIGMILYHAPPGRFIEINAVIAQSTRYSPGNSNGGMARDGARV